MKLDCELIQDLLPLYAEGLCSPASRRAVEAHLSECEHCRRLTAPLPIEEPEDTPNADRAVKKGIKKVRRRWLSSLIAAVLVVPLLLLSFNQYRGYGLCFTNLDDVATAWQFLHALETENWEKAAEMHGFSGDYDSILEALGMDVSDWGSHFIPVDLAGHAYMAKPRLSLSGTVPETIGELYGFLYNREGTAMMPLTLWEQLMAIDPAAFSQEGWDYWLNGEQYGRVTTPWGDFVVSEGLSFDTAYEYASCFDLIPAEVYTEAKPALEEEAWQLYTATHADIGWVAELTEEEFTREMIRRYTGELRALENTVSFDCTGYRSIRRYCDDRDAWRVTFAVTVTQNGRSADVELQISVKDSKIEVAGLSHEPGIQWLDAIDRALYPSAHAGY
ncbi:MAG: zf-HC2 domain-containing protein [Oscillospiraceae bacterium]|nr:zf-HC2 domain-containing protein [Oscillospiraceae bacterium]